MSGAANSNGARRETNESKRETAEPRPAPEWMLGAMRPVVYAVSRALWRISYRGLENIPAEGGLVVAANHQTYADPFWIGARVRRPLRFLAWDEAFGWPLAGRALEFLGAWPLVLDRGNPTAYRRSLQWLRGGGAVMIFPEGQRAYADGELSRFKAGAVRLALEAGAAVLPVTVRGGQRVWPRGQRVPRFSRVEVVFHPTQRPAQLPGEDARQCVQRETAALANVIKSAL
ncbi:MAG TPA: lysophospholipid acyltransferase family protein [Pyrinomonadaceae bacterium]|nr:lysophospholipid acyltransferase family protein [Pyrinomonadaceae bacterium]